MLKKYALVIALGFTILLGFLSLIRLNDLPDFEITFGDKIFHFGAYVVMTLVWYNYFKVRDKSSKTKQIIIAGIIAAVFGTIIELLQGALTVSREADIYDILANSAGVLVAALFLWFAPIKDVKKY